MQEMQGILINNILYTEIKQISGNIQMKFGSLCCGLYNSTSYTISWCMIIPQVLSL